MHFLQTPAKLLAGILLLVLSGCGGQAGAPTVPTTPPSPTGTATAGNPSATIRAFYRAIEQQHLRAAYQYMAPVGRPSYGTFATRYKRTQHVTINRLKLGNYRIHQGGMTYTCAGISLTRKAPTRTLREAGWYMLRERGSQGWRIILPGSYVAQGVAFAIPGKATCKRHIPSS